MLTISDITYRIAGRIILEGASAQFSDRWRVGLVGRNGTGKTTLLRLITGELSLEAGSISIGPRRRIGVVSQEAPTGPESPLEHVLRADIERTELLAEAEIATDPNRIGEIHTRLADIGAHRAEAKASSILAGLGFTTETQNRPLAEFSGGWQMRVALAAALFAEPEILLLDEPTNHLDLEASLWLETYLTSYPYTLLLVSHDRGLLNRVPTHILHLEHNKLTLYPGDYDRFERVRSEKLVRQSIMMGRQMEQRKRIQSFVDRFRYTASKAKQAQSRLKMLEKMEPIAAVIDKSSVSFNIPTPDLLPPPLITLDDAAVGYGDNDPILSRMNLRIDMDDRIGLMGANGNGKTTFLKLLSNRLQVQNGKLQKSSKLKVGYFAQNQLEELDVNQTPLGQMASLSPLATEEKLRSRLGAFGFGQDKAEVAIGKLSGGEKARLSLAIICREAPHILLLDEPTNHLDIDSRQSLIQAIAEYRGAVIIVSHDPHLINACADRLWLIDQGTCSYYDGDMDSYRKLLMDQRKAERQAVKSAVQLEGKPVKPKSKDKKAERQARAEQRAKMAPLRKEIKAAEHKSEKLEADKQALMDQLAHPDMYDNDPQKLIMLNQKIAKVETAIANQEVVWAKAVEALEVAEANS
jgi:ATP-binding cassette subfamily F protein 3